MTVILPSALSLDFNPLPPCGGRPRPACKFRWLAHFNPLPPCGGRLLPLCVSGFCIFISIHSLRVEGDAAGVKRTRNILIFQSTPSVWRETVIWEMQRKRRKYFNPLPPCGGRHVIAPNSHLVQYFNPLPPCGGRPRQ